MRVSDLLTRCLSCNLIPQKSSMQRLGTPNVFPAHLHFHPARCTIHVYMVRMSHVSCVCCIGAMDVYVYVPYTPRTRILAAASPTLTALNLKAVGNKAKQNRELDVIFHMSLLSQLPLWTFKTFLTTSLSVYLCHTPVDYYIHLYLSTWLTVSNNSAR